MNATRSEYQVVRQLREKMAVRANDRYIPHAQATLRRLRWRLRWVRLLNRLGLR